MPMDRRILLGGLAFAALLGSGCRNTRPEIPPDPTFSKPLGTADNRGSAEFGSQAHPAQGNAFPDGLPGSRSAGTAGPVTPPSERRSSPGPSDIFDMNGGPPQPQ